MTPAGRQGKLIEAIEMFHRQAAMTLDDSAAVEELLEEARVRSQPSASLQESLVPLWRLVRAYVRGDYRTVARAEVEWALTAVMYVASQWDLSPDYMPGGLQDDELVAVWVLERIHDSAAKFEAWDRADRKRRAAASPPTA